MSAAPSSPKRYWPFVAALFALAFSIHFLRRGPAATRVEAAHGEGERATGVADVPAARGADTADQTPKPPTPAIPDAPADEVARNVVGALPQGDREAQRLQVMEVEALVRSGRIGSARARAAAYFERWPGGPDTAALETLTGAHPRVDRPTP